ncbi:MAG TPA: hypothetical protein VHJ82_05500 [Actinomycetota bacterium]|nr:hypothetical protein [Actinomycetota bacterium]
MEIDGHPTQDLVEELERRGALKVEGGSGGPNVQALRFLTEKLEGTAGFWLFLPNETFLTGFDEPPP